MKKKMILCLVLMLSLSLICGCSNFNKVENPDNSKDVSVSEDESKTENKSKDTTKVEDENKNKDVTKKEDTDKAKDNNKTETTSEGETAKNTEAVEKDTISLANTTWKNKDTESEYKFLAEDKNPNFKEKQKKKSYDGHYSLTTNKKEVKQYKDLFNASSDELKDLFKEKSKGINGKEFGLSINTDEFESIIHEYYGIYTNNKIIIAEVGSTCTVYVLTR